MENEENKYDPYCKLCNGCGETGCCSPIQCIIQLLKSKPKDCDYGITNVKDVILFYHIGIDLYNKFYKQKKKDVFSRFADKSWNMKKI